MPFDDDEEDDAVGEAPADSMFAPTDALKLLRAKKLDRSAVLERFGGTGRPVIIERETMPR